MLSPFNFGGAILAENETKEILQRLTRLETLLLSKMDNTDKRLDKIEDNQTWLWRSLVGSIMVAAVTFLINR